MKWLPLVLVGFAACSNNSGGGNDGGNGDVLAGGIHQTGQIIDFASKNGVTGATVSSGSSSATTDAKGNYTLTVAKDTPYTMTVSGEKYLTLHEQEWQLSGDADRGQTLAVPNSIEAILKGGLVGLDDTLGVLSVDVIATGSCASPVGATLSVPGLSVPINDAGAEAGAGEAGTGGSGVQLVYFAGGFPTKQTSVTDTSTPSAVIYNLPIGNFSQITVSHPTCTAVAFPVADPNIPTLTYTGNVALDPSGVKDDAGVTQNVASFIRVFLK